MEDGGETINVGTWDMTGACGGRARDGKWLERKIVTEADRDGDGVDRISLLLVALMLF